MPERRRRSSRDRTRSASSAAALRVKVRPSTRSGRTCSLATSQASRAGLVSLLPDPAPARPPAARPARSRLALPAVVADRAGPGHRAGPAARIHPRAEYRAGHAGRDRLDQVLGPARVGILGQRLLRLDLGPDGVAGLAHLDQLGATGIGQAEPLERAEQHGQLVDAELRVPFELVVTGGG